MLFINLLVAQALRLLIKTKINLKAKNLDNSTALDIAASAETKGILSSAGAKPGSKVKNAPTLAQKLRSNITIMDKILIYILRIRKDMSEEQRNAFLIVATLVATATYQSALSPPGGVYEANSTTGDNNNNNSNALNNTSTTNNSFNLTGKSVISEGDFFTLSILNTLSLLLSTLTIYILTPSGLVGSLLFTPIFWFAYCYVYSMKLISPSPATSTFNYIMLHFFNFLHSAVYWTLYIVYKRIKHRAKNREIKMRNRLGGSKW